MTRFPDAFSDFINDLFADGGDEPPNPQQRDLSLVELEDLQKQYFKRLRDRIGRVIKDQAQRSEPDLSEQLTPLQLIIRDEIFAHVWLADDEVEGLTAEQIALYTAFKFMTLAWVVERAMADES